ncbi:hypothetical protein L6452_36270 [Arctium lappa]|uniref:Uncharacterized protein n=1 Tax=Arctium lappa TaxID=4217 RepID=A0ACB8YCX9_ARCLA|nr:hypothetical protein L6452_36270 [Arctium lappa]
MPSQHMDQIGTRRASPSSDQEAWTMSPLSKRGPGRGGWLWRLVDQTLLFQDDVRVGNNSLWGIRNRSSTSLVPGFDSLKAKRNMNWVGSIVASLLGISFPINEFRGVGRAHLNAETLLFYVIEQNLFRFEMRRIISRN